MPVQVPSIILPTVFTAAATEAEYIDDTDEHTSLDIYSLNWLQEKTITVYAQELVAFGVPGNLWVWVETSPVPSLVSTAYFAAIGGGGGAISPFSPEIIVATGTPLLIHTATLSWTLHSGYARVVVQSPIAAALPWAYWAVQVIVLGKG